MRADLLLLTSTFLLCSIAYPASLWGIGQLVFPNQARGSLIERNGRLVGSSQIAQAFTRPEYLHPRPSACDYNAAAAAGSNLAGSNPALRERIVKQLGDSRIGVPADLVTASGSGLDPHITLRGAMRQMDRISAARGRPRGDLEGILNRHIIHPPGGEPIVNVLLFNLDLDR